MNLTGIQLNDLTWTFIHRSQWHTGCPTHPWYSALPSIEHPLPEQSKGGSTQACSVPHCFKSHSLMPLIPMDASVQWFSTLVLRYPLSCMFEMFPCSNTPDSNEWVVIYLCRSLLTRTGGTLVNKPHGNIQRSAGLDTFKLCACKQLLLGEECPNTERTGCHLVSLLSASASCGYPPSVHTWWASSGCSCTPWRRPWSWSVWQPSSCSWSWSPCGGSGRSRRPERGCRGGLRCHRQCSEGEGARMVHRTFRRGSSYCSTDSDEVLMTRLSRSLVTNNSFESGVMRWTCRAEGHWRPGLRKPWLGCYAVYINVFEWHESANAYNCYACTIWHVTNCMQVERTTSNWGDVTLTMTALRPA